MDAASGASILGLDVMPNRLMAIAVCLNLNRIS